MILEGTRLTFETESAFALNEHPSVGRKYRYHLPLISSEWGAFTNPSQYDDLGRFVNEQEVMRRLIGESILPVHELDVSHGDIGRAANEVADWLERTGGLESP